MKKSELCVIVFMLAFCGFFLSQTLGLPSDAQTYPLFIISLLAILTIIKLVNMILANKKSMQVVNDDATVWQGLLPKQFITMSIACLLFLVIMYFLGFYVASVLYLGFCLHYFRISLKNSLITLLVMIVIIYTVFSIFLNVPLPAGELLSDFI